MGLDATVFRIGGDDLAEPDHVAAHARVGNAAMVGQLKKRIAQLLPPESLILKTVLYSGTHTGDAIEAELMPALRRELQTIASDGDPDVRQFRQTMLYLADAATAEGTAITF